METKKRKEWEKEEGKVEDNRSREELVSKTNRVHSQELLHPGIPHFPLLHWHLPRPAHPHPHPPHRVHLFSFTLSSLVVLLPHYRRRANFPFVVRIHLFV